MAVNLISKNVYRLDNEEDYEDALKEARKAIGADLVYEKDIKSYPCVVVFYPYYNGGSDALEMDFVYPRNFE